MDNLERFRQLYKQGKGFDDVPSTPDASDDSKSLGGGGEESFPGNHLARYTTSGNPAAEGAQTHKTSQGAEWVYHADEERVREGSEDTPWSMEEIERVGREWPEGKLPRHEQREKREGEEAHRWAEGLSDKKESSSDMSNRHNEERADNEVKSMFEYEDVMDISRDTKRNENRFGDILSKDAEQMNENIKHQQKSHKSREKMLVHEWKKMKKKNDTKGVAHYEKLLFKNIDNTNTTISKITDSHENKAEQLYNLYKITSHRGIKAVNDARDIRKKDKGHSLDTKLGRDEEGNGQDRADENHKKAFGFKNAKSFLNMLKEGTVSNWIKREANIHYNHTEKKTKDLQERHEAEKASNSGRGVQKMKIQKIASKTMAALAGWWLGGEVADITRGMSQPTPAQQREFERQIQQAMRKKKLSKENVLQKLQAYFSTQNDNNDTYVRRKPLENAVTKPDPEEELLKVLGAPPYAGARFDPTSHRWTKPENYGQTYLARGGKKRIRGTGTGVHERSVSGHGKGRIRGEGAGAKSKGETHISATRRKEGFTHSDLQRKSPKPRRK